MADTPKQIPAETAETPVPIEEAKRELKELAQTIGKDKKIPEDKTEINAIEGSMVAMEQATEGVYEITRKALTALKADLADDNATLETPLTLKDNIIDVETTPLGENPQIVETPTIPTTPRETATYVIPTTQTESPKNTPVKTESGWVRLGKGLAAIGAVIGKFMEQINKLFGTASKYMSVFKEGLSTPEELDGWRALGSASGENIKNLSTIENPKKQEVAQAIAELVPEGKKISIDSLKPVLAGFDAGSLEGEELADALMKHIQKNREKYGYTETKPSEEELKKQETNEKTKKKSEALANIGKIKIDGKDITEIKPDDLKDKEGKMKQYQKYGSTTETISYTNNKYGEYTLWQLYNLKDHYDLEKTAEPKVQLIKNVVAYFELLTPEEKNKEYIATLNDRIKTPLGTELPLSKESEEKNLDPKNPENIIFYAGNFYQINPENKKFYYMYINENANLGRGNTASGIAEEDMLSKGKIISYNEANTTMKAENITNNNIADLAGKLGDKLKPII